MKRLIILLAFCLIFNGCKKAKGPIAMEAKELNLKFLSIAAKKGEFSDFAPDKIAPVDFYEERYRSGDYKIIALDAGTVDRFISDDRVDLLFMDNYAYILTGYNNSLLELYNEYKGIKTTGGKRAETVLYRVYPTGEIRVLELNGPAARDAHYILIVLNQLYNTDTVDEFNAWMAEMNSL
ncbi:MAG: hypothetical protein MR314_03770 [Ezakiella sp.]|nr:hypothetical protein [Ezakiella sp.]